PIEPMHELESIVVGPQHPQRLDHAKAEAAAAMHRDPGRLVDHEEPVVLVYDRCAQGIEQPGGRPCRRSLCRFRLEAYRRDPYGIVELEPLLGTGTAAIYPHLATAHEPED